MTSLIPDLASRIDCALAKPPTTSRSGKSTSTTAAPPPAAHAGAHQAAPAWPLGNDAWVELHVRAPYCAITQHDLEVIYITGPGHGGPAVVANAYLEGTYSELYPDVSHDEEGLKRLFTQFSFPGGIPSYASAETPGSINEGENSGYALAHAYGAAFDNPDLLVAGVIGDGEAETGALATSWHSTSSSTRCTTEPRSRSCT